MNKIRNYRDLLIWQKGIEIVDLAYVITNDFPKPELYVLTAQIRKAAISIPSNIAEGFMRTSKREYAQFLAIALGSCAELDTQIEIAQRRQYVAHEQVSNFKENCKSEAKMLRGLIYKIRSEDL